MLATRGLNFFDQNEAQDYSNLISKLDNVTLALLTDQNWIFISYILTIFWIVVSQTPLSVVPKSQN